MPSVTMKLGTLSSVVTSAVDEADERADSEHQRP